MHVDISAPSIPHLLYLLVTSLIGHPEGGVGPLAKPWSLEEVKGRRPGGRQRLTPGVGNMKTMHWSMITFDPH